MDLPADYISMEPIETWQVFLKWIQQLLSQLSKHYENTASRTDQENLRLANGMLKQFTELLNISSLEKFAQFLSYGSHICFILHLVNNEWVDRARINWSEQVKNSDLLTGENIDLFRSACVKKLGLPPKSVLTLDDLQKLQEFGKLISTFVAISKCVAFQTRLKSMQVTCSPLEVDHYEPYNLSEYCEQSEYYSNRDSQQPIIDMDRIDNSVEGSTSYDSLNSYEYPPSDTSRHNSQSAMDEGVAAVSTPSGDELEEKRRKAYVKIKYILAEIESTEENYSNQLQFLDSVYRKSMYDIGHGDLVPEILDDTRISDLAAAHLSLLSDLIAAQGHIVAFTEECMRPDRIKLMVQLYTSYLKNYNRAQDKLDIVLANLSPEKQDVLNKADNRAATGGSKSFDIKTNFKQPFQRFCRYPLLLKTLLDAVEKTSEPEKIEVVSLALKTWKHVTDHLNLVKADEEMSSSTLPKVLARAGIIEEIHPVGANAVGDDHETKKDHETRHSMTDLSGFNSERRGSRPQVFKAHNYNRVEEFEKYGRFIKDESLVVIVENASGEKSIASKLMAKKSHKYNVALTELQLIFNKNTILNLRMGLNSDLNYETGKFTKGAQSSVPSIKFSKGKTSYILTFSSQFNFDAWKLKFDQVIDMCKRDPVNHHSHIFEYYSFQVEKEAVFCSVCGFVLKGLVWQGHICIICKYTVHPACRAESPKCGAHLRKHEEATKRPARSMSVLNPPSPVEEPISPTLSHRMSSVLAPVGKATRSSSLMDQQPVPAPRRNQPPISPLAVSVLKHRPFHSSCNSMGSIGEHSLVESEEEHRSIEDEGWFIGMASKSVTKSNLDPFLDRKGTFLVRLSDRDPGYRLAVVDSNSQVKHIQIFEREGMFYLEEDQMFPSVSQLLSFYSKTNLSSVFADYLDVYLTVPLSDACYDYIRQFSGENSLGKNGVNAVGAGVLLRPVQVSVINANLQQGQLVFVVDDDYDNFTDMFQCQLSLNRTGSIFQLSRSDVRLITAFGTF